MVRTYRRRTCRYDYVFALVHRRDRLGLPLLRRSPAPGAFPQRELLQLSQAPATEFPQGG